VLALRKRPEVYEEIGPAAALGLLFVALVSRDHNGVLLGLALLSALWCAAVEPELGLPPLEERSSQGYFVSAIEFGFASMIAARVCPSDCAI